MKVMLALLLSIALQIVNSSAVQAEGPLKAKDPSNEEGGEVLEGEQLSESQGNEEPLQPQSIPSGQQIHEEESKKWMWTLIVALAILVLVVGGLAGWQVISRSKEKEERILLEELLRQEIHTELAPLYNELKSISASFDRLLRPLEKLSQQIFDSSGTILNEISSATMKMVSNLGTLPSALRKEINHAVQAQLRAEAEKVTKEKIATLVSTMREKVDAMRRDYPVIDVAHEMKQVILPLSSQSDLKISFEGLITPYVELSDEWGTLLQALDHLGEQRGVDLRNQVQRLRKDMEVFREKASRLSQNHRPIWFIPLLEKAAWVPALSEKAESLKSLLGIEDIPIQVGAEVRNIGDFDVIRTDGMGRRNVIDDVIERGYREKATGTVIKKPRVIIRLEG